MRRGVGFDPMPLAPKPGKFPHGVFLIQDPLGLTAYAGALLRFLTLKINSISVYMYYIC